jgi:hypothetical protein
LIFLAGHWSPSDLPQLTSENHSITSPRDTLYNCIGWAADDKTNWWPSKYGRWPKTVSRVETLEAFVMAFATRGCTPCDNGTLEDGFEKVVIYAQNEDGALVPTHAARQLPDGYWTSKIGWEEDISHQTPEDVNGPIYGKPVQFLKRPRRSTTL